MARRRLFVHSHYKRTTLTLVAVILLAFFVLLAAFYKIISSSVNEVRTRQLKRAANELSMRLSKLWAEEGARQFFGLKDSLDAVAENMSFIGHLTNAYAWLVLPNGEIIYKPETMEDEMDAKLFYRVEGSSRLFIPEKYVGNDVPDEGVTIKGGNFQGFFAPVGSTWLSVVKPVMIGDVRVCYLHLHERVSLMDDIRLYLLNGLAISLIVAVVVALFFVWVFTRELSRPITLLSNAANRVALGDFSVEVSLPPAGMLSLLDESSDLNTLVSTFNHMIRRLGQMNSEQRDFISSISHDIRTPLTSIIGFIDAVLDGTVPIEEAKTYLSFASGEAKRLGVLVREMNSVVQLDGHSIEYHFENFDLYRLIREVINSLSPIFDERKISIQTEPHLGEAGNLAVRADRGQIQRVLVNLLQNASKFVPEAGIIAVSVVLRKTSRKKEKEVVLVAIEDNGCGVAPEDQEHIFERFFKSDRSRSGRSGSGLGLHICKQILGAHNQMIWLEKSDLGGARFCFTLPAAKEKEELPTKRAGDSGIGNEENETKESFPPGAEASLSHTVVTSADGASVAARRGKEERQGEEASP